MPLLEAIRLALAMLRAQKLKSFFSLLGVVIGVTFLIAVVSIVQGMNVYMEDQFANRLVGLNTFQLRRLPSINTDEVPAETRRQWLRRPRITYADAAYIEERLTVPAVFSRSCSEPLPIGYRGRITRDVEVIGADAELFAIRNWVTAEGRPFSPQEVRAGAAVAVLGHLVAERLFEGEDPIGKFVSLDGIPYRVVGVVEPQGTLFGISLDRFVVVPFEAPVKRRICLWNTLDELHIKTSGPSAMLAAMDEVESLMRIRRRLKPSEESNFALQTAEGALAGWRRISAVLFAALPGLVGISLVVGGIVIMNIMLMAVAERTREIGTRKALGARRRDILAQFVVEAATLSTVGAAFGIVLGIALAFLVKSLTPFPAAVAPWSVGAAVLLGVAVGMAAGVYPASRAARLDPVEALRHE